MEKFSSEDIFNKWKYELTNKKRGELYLYREREDHIIDLISMFHDVEIDYDEVKTFRNQVLNTLTTREGRKGTGKYKGWKENVLSDFDKVAAGHYVDIPSKPVENKVEPANIAQLDEDRDLVGGGNDSLINEWVDKKLNGNEFFRAVAHDPMTDLYLEFIEDNFGEYL